ncbi:TonB-dependent siderophore receptor [Sphingobacterium corticibacter]|uniref:TonB-dependent receptor n=1 Tax=Sphingobacterium corticibacter TaxID=2171749 RepID=A0A2T8HN90_9SPHI|nr:TonB-dependent receptor [Sphingobacterium corticibacter]PVH26914.1 TonB-dependent receptor [Sphingobacterium corticibacter]
MKHSLPCIAFFLAIQSLSAQQQQRDTQRTRDTSITRNVEDVIIDGYVKKNSPTVNRMPLKAIENSQVFSSIDRVALENQQITTVDDGFRNVVGLQKMWNATNRGGDGGAYVNLRGFVTNNSLRDGYVAPVTSMMDAINVEKIEVLKGPSATLFGTGPTSYGGVINRVTKKPYEEFGGQVAIFGGSFNHYRAQADINTPLNENKSLLFRLNTAYTNTGTFQIKDARNQFFILAPSLTWRVNDRLDINLEYEHFENRAIGEQSVFFSYSPSQYGYSDMHDLVKDTGMQYRESYIGKGLYNRGRTSNLFATAHYQISDRILSTTAVNKAYNRSDGRNPFFYIGRENLWENTGVLGIHQADQSTSNSHQDIFQIQQNFNFEGQIGEMRNRLVVGGDYMRTNNRQFFYSATMRFMPFTGGDYGAFNADFVDAYYQNLRDQGTFDAFAYPMIDDKDTYSVYASDVLTLTPGLNVMAALRYESNDFLGGNLYNAVAESYKQSGWSPKFGAVYEIVKDKFSVFANYQNSFTSNGYFISDVSGTVSLSKPETANQWEGGLKADLLKGRVNASLSYYDITVRNSLQNNGLTTGGGFLVQDQLGERTSRGVELEVNAYLVKGFTVIGGVSYNDSKISETTDASTLGRRPTTGGAPWQANFYANYNFLDGALKGLAFGFGGNHVGAIPIFNTTTAVFELPKYTVLNANAYYDYKQFRIGVRMDNLTNERYWIGYSTANAQPTRNIIGNLTYRF